VPSTIKHNTAPRASFSKSDQTSDFWSLTSGTTYSASNYYLLVLRLQPVLFAGWSPCFSSASASLVSAYLSEIYRPWPNLARLPASRSLAPPKFTPVPARTEVMSILQTQPDTKEVCVKKVYPLRFAGDPSQEKYDQLFQLTQRFDAQVERTAPLGLL
jgi:hypothetical protein